jgi:hypothetical protein
MRRLDYLSAESSHRSDDPAVGPEDRRPKPAAGGDDLRVHESRCAPAGRSSARDARSCFGNAVSFLTPFDELIISLFLAGLRSETLPVRIWNSFLLGVEPTIAAVSNLLIAVTCIALAVK